MDDNLSRWQTARPRRVSAAAADSDANASLQDGDVMEAHPPSETPSCTDRLSAAAGIMDRRNSGSQLVHQRHMPMQPNKFHIPRKTKEKRALFQDVSIESREFEDMMNILTSSYFDAGSAGCFTYSKPRLVHSELLEKEFVEKRREMKLDGRTDKELEESYGFLLVDAVKLPLLCENGLCVGQSWITVLGNPSKGVYLSRYSDLLQVNNPFVPGATGEIIIFKAMKGKIKSIYENMKNLLDPTPRFDSHILKNASKVTSLTSYRAFEFTQQYFYEYSFDELRQRPRQVCPYAVVSFQFKGKETPLLRLNSQSSEGSKERAHFTVWTGDLVQGDRVLFQISLRSFSPPLLPHKLPEKLKIGCVMRLDQVTKLLPSGLFSYNRYKSSQEVVENGFCCSLLEVTDRSRATTNVTKLLRELEMERVVLVTPLTERGFLFLLSSVQMATPSEREEDWKRCLQALFVFPKTRDVSKSKSKYASSSHDAPETLISAATVMPRLMLFIPALHHALVKARANPSPELSAGVERQAREYLIGLNDGKARQYPMGEYNYKDDDQEKQLVAPKHHKVNLDSYLRSYLYGPSLYLLSVARAKQMVEAHSGPEEPQQVRPKKGFGNLRESTGKEVTGNTRDRQTNTKKMQQLIDLVLTCKRNAENEVRREEGGERGLKAPGRKRRLEQQTAARALKFLKATQGPGGHDKIPVQGSQVPTAPGSLGSVISSVGLRDVDVRDDGSELASKLLSLLKGLQRAARGKDGQESCPFDKLATKLGLPTNCDIDLRKQQDLEEQTAGSVSSLEGFSPSSHSGEMNHHGAVGRRGAGGYEEGEDEWAIPWVLIPITGLSSERYSQRDKNIPRDPRFQHLTVGTNITTTTTPPRMSPTLSPEPSPPSSPSQYTSKPSLSTCPSQCPSPDPSPPRSPFHCPSPEPGSPFFLSQCPFSEHSLAPSSSQCPSPQPSPPPFPPQHTTPQLSPPCSPSHGQSLEPMECNPLDKANSAANERCLAPEASREITGMSKHIQEKPQVKAKQNEEPSIPRAPKKRMSPLPPTSKQGKEYAQGEMEAVKEDDVILVEGEHESQPVKKLGRRGSWKQRENEVRENKQDNGEVVDMIQEVANEKLLKAEVTELVDGSLASPSTSSPPACPLENIDHIVDKHLGNISSEIQRLLQEESIQYTFPQSPHSTSNTETSIPQHTLPHTLTSQFSHYVSYYNPSPPVQDYVGSLQDSINSMLRTEFGDSWRSRSADTVLASSVGAFVASIRAANTTSSRADEASVSCAKLTAADASASISQAPAPSSGAQVWQQDADTRLFPDAANSRNSPASNVTLSVPTPASGSVHNPTDTTDLHPYGKLPQAHWNSQQSHMLEINRTVAHDVRPTQDNSSAMTDVDGESCLAGSSSNLTLPGSSSISQPLPEPELGSSLPAPAPPATDLNSLIEQLDPEVFSSLVKIIKDVKKRSLQFYLLCTEPRDQVYEEVKEHLLKQGYVEQIPVSFLNQENGSNRLLVIVKNKDIAGHIHKIPSLVSLKRRPSVLFVGIDTLDDIRNNSYNELFVSGGCIVSEELILSPDCMTHGQLAELLMLLEKHSSEETIWKWKVHCKTHKKLKEQARFRRDAANMLDILSAYQKRQIVEFLPYHHCDMTNHQSPDLQCLMELQARYTQYRHTIFLTEHSFEKSPAYINSGIIIVGIKEILNNFTRLVGYHDIKDKQLMRDTLLATKSLGRQLCHGDSMSGTEHSPSIFPEHIPYLSSIEQPQRVLQQPSSSLLPHPHLSDQLVPDGLSKDGMPHPSDPDFEVLRMAISQLRAERQAQLQQQQGAAAAAEFNISSPKSFLSSLAHGHATSPVDEGGPTESIQHTTGRQTMEATLQWINTALQPQLTEANRTKDREPSAEGQRRGRGLAEGEGDSPDGTAVRVVELIGGNHSLNNHDTFTLSSNQNTATVTGPSDQTELTNAESEIAAQLSAAHSTTTSCPVGDNGPRDIPPGQDWPVTGEGATPESGTKVTGNVPMVTGQEDNPSPALPQVQQIHQPSQHLQFNKQQQFKSNLSHQQPPPHHQQQHRGNALLRTPLLPQLPAQSFSAGPLLRPQTAVGRARSLMGPTPVWSGGLGPTGAAALVWGFPQAVSGPGLLRVYHNPAGQGSNRFRGVQRGGFNGM